MKILSVHHVGEKIKDLKKDICCLVTMSVTYLFVGRVNIFSQVTMKSLSVLNVEAWQKFGILSVQNVEQICYSNAIISVIKELTVL